MKFYQSIEYVIAFFLFICTFVFVSLLAIIIQYLQTEKGFEFSSLLSLFFDILLILWLIIIIERLIYLTCCHTKKNIISVILTICFPPLRLASRSCDLQKYIWLPFHWQRVDDKLYLKLEKIFLYPIFICSLAMVPIWLIEIFWPQYLHSHASFYHLATLGNALIWELFVIEFVVMFSIAPKRFDYIKQHWLELLIIVLPILAVARVILIARYASLLKQARLLQYADLIKAFNLPRLLNIYRARAVLHRIIRILMVIDILRRVYLFRAPNKYLKMLKNKLAEQEKVVMELKRQINEIEKNLLDNGKKANGVETAMKGSAMEKQNSTFSSHAWQESEASATFEDPLLQCLVILTKIFDQPHSTQALKAGLPLVNNRFTPELFIRAAERANLSAQLLKKPLRQFNRLLLPAVLLLKDGQACILLKCVGRWKKRAQIILPASGEGVVELPIKDLQANYSGYALFARPRYTFDDRTLEHENTHSWTWFWGTVFKSWPIYSEVLIASFLINLFALASPLFVMNVYDRVVPNNATETLWVLALGVSLVFCFDFVMRIVRGYFIDFAGKKSDIILASRIFEHILGAQRAAQPRSVGAFANHLHEFDSFRDFFTSATLTTLIDLPFALLFIFVIWTFHPELAQIPLYAMPLVIIFSLIIQIPLSQVIQQSFRANAQKQALLIETLTNIERLKTIAAEGEIQRRWELLLGQITQSSLRSRFLSALAIHFAVFVQQMTVVAVVVFGVYLIGAGELTMGALIASTILTGRALAPLAPIANLLTRYHQSRAALSAINRVMKMPLERPAKRHFLHRPQLRGQIDFKQVDFTYPEQALSALKQATFQIKAGQKVGILGRIGSGKSTIAKLILGLYQPQSGRILLDGIDSRQIDPADLRRNFGYVPQDIELFYGSVKDNIIMGASHVADSEILRAAQLAGVDEFVNQHPLGFNKPIGERGTWLSGGQRQAIVLARALLLNPPILLFDEPTNAMDNRAEEQLKTRLQPYLKDKTLLLVTHRMSLLSLVDYLIVMDGGQVVAMGAKEQVIQALTK
jgi:ATP-binding cassette subfamily C protein LapB